MENIPIALDGAQSSSKVPKGLIDELARGTSRECHFRIGSSDGRGPTRPWSQARNPHPAHAE